MLFFEAVYNFVDILVSGFSRGKRIYALYVIQILYIFTKFGRLRMRAGGRGVGGIAMKIRFSSYAVLSLPLLLLFIALLYYYSFN